MVAERRRHMIALVVLASAVVVQPSWAVPKTAAPSGEAAPAAEGEPTVLEDAAPTLQDSSPTVEPAEMKEVEPQNEAVMAVSNSVAAAVLLPDRCVLPIQLPAEEGTTPAESDEDAELSRECVEMVDAEPSVLTPSGPVPISESVSSSSTEEALLLRLQERRTELESRQQELQLQTELLEAAEKRLSERAADLADIELNIGALVSEREEQSSERIEQLVALYESMKPADAAAVLPGLPDDVLRPIITAMSASKLAAILAKMDGRDARAATLLMLQSADTTAQP